MIITTILPCLKTPPPLIIAAVCCQPDRKMTSGYHLNATLNVAKDAKQ